MALSSDQEFALRHEELKIKSAEVKNREKELLQQDAQRKTSALVTILAALVAVIGSLGSQVVARLSPDKPATQNETLSLHMGLPLLRSETAGIYLYDAKAGRLWIAKQDAADKVSWIIVAPPSVQKAAEQGAPGDAPKAARP